MIGTGSGEPIRYIERKNRITYRDFKKANLFNMGQHGKERGDENILDQSALGNVILKSKKRSKQ